MVLKRTVSLSNEDTFKMTHCCLTLQQHRIYSQLPWTRTQYTESESFVWFDSLRPLNNLSVMRDGSSWVEPVLSLNVSCSRTTTQWRRWGSTRGPSVSSQALYHWATALPESESWIIICAVWSSVYEATFLNIVMTENKLLYWTI